MSTPDRRRTDRQKHGRRRRRNRRVAGGGGGRGGTIALDVDVECRVPGAIGNVPDVTVTSPTSSSWTPGLRPFSRRQRATLANLSARSPTLSSLISATRPPALVSTRATLCWLGIGYFPVFVRLSVRPFVTSRKYCVKTVERIQTTIICRRRQYRVIAGNVVNGFWSCRRRETYRFAAIGVILLV